MKNFIITKNIYSATGQKQLTSDNTIEFDNLSNLYYLLRSVKYLKKVNVMDKHKLPYILTTTSNLGALKGQRGHHNYLILDVDGGESRNNIEKQFNEYEYISYYSFSNGIKDGERFRIIIKLDKAYSSDTFDDIKQQLINKFPYVDINSYKANTLMYLPVNYENKRDAVIRYNEGIAYNLDYIVRKVQAEVKKQKQILANRVKTMKTMLPKIPVFDKDKQQKKLDEVLSTYEGEGRGVTHNWLFKSMMQLKSAGIDDSTIIDVLSSYETREHKGKVARDVDKYSTIVSPYFYFKSNVSFIANKITKIEPIKNGSQKIQKVKQYLTEATDLIANKMKKYNKILIEADTNIGKTFYFTHLNTAKNVLILLPTRNLTEQLESKLKKEGKKFNTIMGGRTLDIDNKLIIGTYDSIIKFKSENSKEWLKNAIVVIDEAHNLTISGDFSFRQRIMRKIKTIKCLQTIYLTATPIYDSSIENFEHIVIQKEVRRNKNFKVIFYKERLKSLFNKIKSTSGKQIIYLNNKKQLEQISILLKKEGLKTQLITSDSIEEFENLITNGEVEKDIDILLTTSVLGEGFRLQNKFEALHILSKISPELIHQMSERTENEAIANTYLYLIYSKELFSQNYLQFNEFEYKQELINEAKSIIEFKKAHQITIDTYLSLRYEASNDIYKSKEALETIIKKANLAFDTELSENSRNICYNSDNEYFVNEIGINYEVYKAKVNFLYKNYPLLIAKILTYNFTILELEYDKEKFDKEIRSSMKKAQKELKKKNVEEYSKKVKNILFNGNDVIDIKTLYVIEKRIEKVKDVISVTDEEMYSILSDIGDSERMLNLFLNNVVYSMSNLKLRKEFNKDKIYTSIEINDIINKYRIKNTPYTTILSKTKTTQLFNNIFESKSVYIGSTRTRGYKILSNNSYKNIAAKVKLSEYNIRVKAMDNTFDLLTK